MKKPGNYPFRPATTILLAGLLAWHPARGEWVEYIADVSAEVMHTDNLNQSAFSDDEESDTGLLPSASLGRYYQLTDLTRLRLTVDLDADFYRDFDDLNSATAHASAVLRHKFGVGPMKPWIRANASTGYKDAKVNIRDSWLHEAGLRVGKRLTGRLDGSLGAAYSIRNGNNGDVVVPGIDTDVFDQENWSASANMNFLVTNQGLLSATWTYRDGEFDSACTVGNVGKVLAKEDVKAITFDKVFGGCVYRLKGHSNRLHVNYSHALGRHAALNAGYEYRKGEADELDYTTNIFRLSVNYSY